MQQSVQQAILETAKNNSLLVTVHLTNGYKIVGKIEGFDDFTLLMKSDGKQVFIYKHAVSTMTPSEPIPINGVT